MENKNLSITSDDNIIELKYTPKQALNVLAPVSICLLVTIITSLLTKKTFSINEREYSLNNDGFKQTIQSEIKDTLMTLTEILFMCGFYTLTLIAMTLIILFIIYMNWYKLLTGMLSITLGSSLLFVNFLFWTTIMASFELSIDFFTALLLILNNAVLAHLSIMWKSPNISNKIYQIQLAVLIGWFLDNLTPIWLGWLLLSVLSIWDLIAVLPSFGPLKLIIDILDKRDQKIPDALIYSVYFNWPALIKLIEFLKSNEQLEVNINNNNNLDTVEQSEIMNKITSHVMDSMLEIVEPLNQSNKNQVKLSNEDDGPKLGLGDFVFYSLLIAKSTSQLNFTTMIACFLGILIGLIITMLLTAIYKKPLPALPLSIFLSTLIFFTNEYTVVPYLNRLNLKQIFI